MEKTKGDSIMVDYGLIISVGVFITIIVLLMRSSNNNRAPIDNKRRPFSFDEKVFVIAKNVLKWGKPRCEYCGAEKNFDIDHIKPIHKGGHNGIDNLQLLCKKCNQKKGAR